MEDDLKPILDAWTIETADILARVQSAVGAPSPSEFADLIAEIRALRREMADLRRTIAVLQHDASRQKGNSSTPIRIAAYSPVESLVRLS